MKRILYIVDNIEYVENNCFQSQLLQAARYCYDIDIFEVSPTRLGRLKKLFSRKRDSYDSAVSVLRLRSLNRSISQLNILLKNGPLRIYDQDPWESYIDSSPIKGVYKRLAAGLLIEKVFVTAPWWAKRLAKEGIPAEFIRMGISPRWCDLGPPMRDRRVAVGFRGALHAHRQVIFQKLQGMGIDVEIPAGRLSYADYMKYLHGLKVFAHDESAPWICDGQEISRSTGMWVKSIETAARGTFCVRNFHEEGEAYAIRDIPLIQCYRDPLEAPDIIRKIIAMPEKESRDTQAQSVEVIRSRNDWIQAAYALCN
jgi:hypothetical protein